MSETSTGENEGGEVLPPPSTGTAREKWTSPGGISAIAAVAAVLCAVIALVVGVISDDSSSGTDAAASVVETTSSSPDAPSSAAHLLFVYGSSMPGQSRYEFIERFVESYEADSVPGFLYDSGQDYPLAQFGPGESIDGFVLTLHQDSAAEAFREMTAIEAGLFERVLVRTASGLQVNAYEWIGAIDGYPRIDSPWDGA